jgi:hypothetical protein
MFNSKQIKKAWKIRKEAAVLYGCGVMEISWKICLEMVAEVKEIKESEISTTEARKIEGRFWEKGSNFRYYFSNKEIEEFAGIELNFDASVWYDFKTKKLAKKKINASDFKIIKSAIINKLSERY